MATPGSNTIKRFWLYDGDRAKTREEKQQAKPGKGERLRKTA